MAERRVVVWTPGAAAADPQDVVRALGLRESVESVEVVNAVTDLAAATGSPGLRDRLSRQAGAVRVAPLMVQRDACVLRLAPQDLADLTDFVSRRRRTKVLLALADTQLLAEDAWRKAVDRGEDMADLPATDEIDAEYAQLRHLAGDGGGVEVVELPRVLVTGTRPYRHWRSSRRGTDVLRLLSRHAVDDHERKLFRGMCERTFPA